MIQHRDSFKKFFIYNAPKSKNKHITAQTQLVLNLKKKCLYFSKRIKNKNIYLKKFKTGFVQKTLFLLKMLLVVFNILIKQKIIKKNCVLYKKIIKKTQIVSENTYFFIINISYIFFPQNNLKQ